MSEAKFTKGEWQIFGDWGIKDSSGRLIAQFEPLNDEISIGNTAESFANANLMKTSPKMYKMLENLARMLTDTGIHPIANDIEKLLSEARGDL